MTNTLWNEGEDVLFCGFSTFQKKEMLIFSLKFDQSYPFTKMAQKVCQKSAV